MSDPLLQPLRLKHLTLKNRIISTAHEPAYSEDGLPKERYRAYHLEKARGGLAMTMIGGSAIVSPDSPPAFGNLHIYKDEIVPWLKNLADSIHEHDCAVMIQITHLGRRTGWNTGDWLPVVAPSPLREPAHRAFPKAAEDWDLERIKRDYAAAAQRCQAAHLDGIELEAYGHLLDAFWSPATNHRDDAYGGGLDNRLRFSLEVLEAMRKAVGPGFIIGVRMVVDEDRPGGLDQAQGLAIARRLEAEGIDFINVIKGHIDTDAGLAQVIPGMGTPAGPHLELAGAVKRAVTVPIMHAARINDLATARHAIREGLVDLVGMTRAHLADPAIVAKLQTGQEERIRPCVGAGYCIDRIYENGEALCIHNPATGREQRLPQTLSRGPGPYRNVVVVGAGPAGLEAARVAAARGHRVIVLEAADRPGGQLRLAAAIPRRRELMGIIDWRVGECERLGVVFRYNVYAEAAEVLAENPDVVIVATGGLPNTEFLEEGADLVSSSWDVLGGEVGDGGEVLVFDDSGGHPALTAAEALLRGGARLEYVTPERVLAPEVGGVNYPAYFKLFAEHEVRVSLCQRLLGVRREGGRLLARLYNEYADRHTERIVDQVVVEHGVLPLDEVYFALKPDSINGGEVDYPALIEIRPQTIERNPEGRYRLFRIGDAVAGRNIHAAVYDGLRLGLGL